MASYALNIYKVEDGWVVSDHETWLPGFFDSPLAAAAWAMEPDDNLAEAWEKVKPRPLSMPDKKE